VGEHGALGFSGGSRGVQDDRDVIGAALHRRLLRGQVGDQVHQAGVVDNPGLRTGFVGAGTGFTAEGRRSEQCFGAAVGQVERDLAGLEQRIHRDRDGAAVDDAVEHDGEGGRVGQHHADPVPRFDSGLFEQRRYFGGGRVELGEGELQLVATQRDAFGVALRGGEEVGAQAGHHVPPRLVWIATSSLISPTHQNNVPRNRMATGSV